MHMHELFEVAARSKVDGLVSWRHTFDLTCDPSLLSVHRQRTL